MMVVGVVACDSGVRTASSSLGSAAPAPAPLKAAGARVVPAGITSARIESLASDKIGDGAFWFAVEIRITAAGSTRMYRALELLDGKTGQIAVATFAPLAPFARSAAAPPMPIATPAGPLADLLVSPRAARAAVAPGHARRVEILGTDADERATYGDAAKSLLARWNKLALVRDAAVAEVHTATWGYAVATVSFAKPGGAPYRMAALVLATPTASGAWSVSAIHYLAL